MSETDSIPEMEKTARNLFLAKNYFQAADSFLDIEKKYQESGDALMAAEMANNRSVCLLMNGNPADALQACLQTDKIFSQFGDIQRMAISVGNQASALQALGKKQDALALYQKACELLKGIGDVEYMSIIQKKIFLIQIQLGHPFEAVASMKSALVNEKEPGFRDTILKHLLNMIIK